MSLRAARSFEKNHTDRVKIMDLRWLQPLNAKAIKKHAEKFDRIIIVDEGRRSACVGEGVISILAEQKLGFSYLKLITGADTFTPLADAAKLVLPDEQIILKTLKESEV